MVKVVGYRRPSLGEEGATRADLMAVGRQFFVSLYGQSAGTSMNQARYNTCTHKQEKQLRSMSVPPTYIHLYLHT